MRYVEKASIFTRGGNGIDRAITLASEGAAIVIMDLRPEDADAAAESISKTGGRALAVTGDATVEGDVAATVERAVPGVYRSNAARRLRRPARMEAQSNLGDRIRRKGAGCRWRL